jgi:hypothetical protein
MEFAVRYDTNENKTAGLKIVDFIAESKDKLMFIEVKNFARTSDDPIEQDELLFNRQLNIYRLNSKCQLFPLEIGMKFKDCLFQWLAEGKTFDKTIVLLFIVNLPPEFSNPERLTLLHRIRTGFVPSGMDLERYTKMKPIFFDMPPLNKVKSTYHFSVTLHNTPQEAI